MLPTMLIYPHFSRCGSQSQVEFLITSGEHMWAEMLPEQIVHNSDNVTANILHAGVYEAPFPPAPPVTVVYSLCTVTTKLCSDMSFLGSCRCGRDRALPRPSHRGGVLSRMWRHVSSPSHALLVSRQLCLIVIDGWAGFCRSRQRHSSSESPITSGKESAPTQGRRRP